MIVETTALPGVVVIEPDVRRDARGFFFEGYHETRYRDEAGINEQFVFTRRGRAGDDQGPGSIDTHRVGQFVRTVDVIGDFGRVPFHRSRDDLLLLGHPHLAEASCVGVVLCGDECKASEIRPEHGAEQSIAARAAFGQPSVDDTHRAAPSRGGADEIRPHLQLDQHHDVRSHAAEESAHGEREVQRIPHHAMAPVKQGLRPVATSIGCCRDDDQCASNLRRLRSGG